MGGDPYRYYRVEARELLDALGQGILDVEKGAGGREVVGKLLRHAHTLKGASRVVKLAEMASIAHRVEEELEPHRDGEPLPPSRCQTIVGLLSRAAELLEDLNRSRAPTTAVRAAEAVPPVRLDVDEVDAVLRILSERGAQRATLRGQLLELDQAQRLAAALADQLGPRRAASGASGSTTKASALADDLRTALARARRRLGGTADQAERDDAELRDAAERLRLASTAALFLPLERAARDAALALGKRVEFITTGGENRLDVDVLPPLRQALLHIVRNAVAHGIEAPHERAAAGKPEQGRLELRIERRDHHLAFSCRDDGRGVDVEAVRRALVQRGTVTAGEAASLDRERVLRLLLRGGFTTSRQVDEMSGRGIGLDVVRDVADRLRGEVSLKSDPGIGTIIELRVPVTLSSTAVLFVGVGGTVAAIPLSAVEKTFRVPARGVLRSEGAEVVVDGSETLFFAHLRDTLKRSEGPPERTRACSAVLLHDQAGRAAIGVDRLLGVETALVRPVPPLAPPSSLVSGVSLDATGVPRLVLDPRGLIEAVQRHARTTASATPAARPRVLVVDDSLTTRMLEQSILESAGYDVDLAISGEEAFARAAQQRYGLFVVDVEMPGMDGFEFVARTRADPGLRGTPALLVTSRGSAEDRRRGEEAGARGYIVKSEFDQAHLLRTIRELMG